MKTKEMIEYLQNFDTESEICIMNVDTTNRVFCETEEVVMITDRDGPVFISVLNGNTEPFDDELSAGELVEQFGDKERPA